jgi:uncharacterized coiled-coil DUF342 family protein
MSGLWAEQEVEYQARIAELEAELADYRADSDSLHDQFVKLRARAEAAEGSSAAWERDWKKCAAEVAALREVCAAAEEAEARLGLLPSNLRTETAAAFERHALAAYRILRAALAAAQEEKP